MKAAARRSRVLLGDGRELGASSLDGFGRAARCDARRGPSPAIPPRTRAAGRPGSVGLLEGPELGERQGLDRLLGEGPGLVAKSSPRRAGRDRGRHFIFPRGFAGLRVGRGRKGAGLVGFLQPGRGAS